MLYGGKRVSDEASITMIKLLRNSFLGKRNSIIYIPSDTAITKNIIRNGFWEKEEVRHLSKAALKADGKINLIDLGAHAGLISLQVLNLVPGISRAILVEPVPLHAKCINLNLLPFNSKIELCNVALAKVAGIKEGFSDLANRGNFTLEHTAAANKYESIRVETIGARKFSQSLSSLEGDLILKSDLQGLDAEVLDEFDSEVWERTIACVIEVWSLPVVNKETVESLVKKLQLHFSVWEIHLMDFESRIKVSPDELSTRWTDSSGRYTNLFLTKY
jgi:FkbM family methyltransferase